jgi:very-short-patch-repair endonuclease
MSNVLPKYEFKYSGQRQFRANNKVLAEFLVDNFGRVSQNKRIAGFVKNLNKTYLKIILESLVDGDGSVRPNTKKKPTSGKYSVYTTTSSQLRDDVMEICLKLGFSPTMYSQPLRTSVIVVNGKKKTIHSKLPQWTVCWSDSECGKFPTLASRDMTKKSAPQKQTIFDVPYQGKVWCVEVPNHYIITERNGKIGIHGNSSAAIGVEVMIDKLDSWRHELSEWVEQKIYLQVAKMKGFIEKNEWGEHEYVYPKLKWDIMHLRDQQQMRTFMLQLHEKGTISTQTMLKSFDIDYDQEVELLRYERAKGAASGGQQQGGMGGGFSGGGPAGGLPDLGGLGGDMGGEMPGGDIGGAPGGAPGGDAGGGAPGGPMEATSMANIKEFGGKVLKKKSREKITKYREKIFKRKQDNASGYIRDDKGRIMLTGPERELLREIATSVKRGELRHAIQSQFPVKAGDQEYSIDFAMPDIKLGIEVDGALFHSTEDQKASDKHRDSKLAQQGWTILRFTDKEVENKTRQIIETIIKYQIQKENWMKQQR